jgi:hypothetical protein
LMGGDLDVRAQCLAQIPSVHDQDDSAQSYCVFFFEVGACMGCWYWYQLCNR